MAIKDSRYGTIVMQCQWSYFIYHESEGLTLPLSRYQDAIFRANSKWPDVSSDILGNTRIAPTHGSVRRSFSTCHEIISSFDLTQHFGYLATHSYNCDRTTAMRTKIITTSRVFPHIGPNGLQEAKLPPIDSWYAHRRSLVVVYLFRPPPDSSRSSLLAKLKTSLAKTLDSFPQLAGRLKPHSIDVHTADGLLLSIRRPKIVWGDNDPESGVEFIEAESQITLDELLPPTGPEHNAFMWDRSGAPFAQLFPRTPLSESLVRAQVTWLQCGGFAIAVDMDHAMADAHVVGLFMQYWSANFSNESTSGLPPVRFLPDLASQLVGDCSTSKSQEMLERAGKFAIRRPLVRDHSGSRPRPSAPSPPTRKSAMINGMLHLSAAKYRRITQEIQHAANVRVTDQVAVASFVWAAMNRAKKAHGYGVDLHMSVSFRGKLDFPAGTLGSPFIVVMLHCGDGSDDSAKLAAIIMETLSQYDESAMRSIAYQANLEDSPDGSYRPQNQVESIIFSSAVQSGWIDVAFGPNKPVFLAPILPYVNVFTMVESLDTNDEDGFTEKGWHGGGVNIFFTVSPEVYEAMSSDPAFLDFDKLQDL